MAKYNHLIICDICDFQFHRNEVKKNWKNQIVCHADYEEKHPQLTIKPRRDDTAVKDVRVPNDPPLADPPFTTSQIV